MENQDKISKRTPKLKYWWVHQQPESFKVEFEGNYLFSGITDKRGGDVYKTMRELKPRDAVLHYVEGSIIAISRVQTSYTEERRIVPLPSNPEEGVGYLVRTEYFLLKKQIVVKHEIPVELRKRFKGEAGSLVFDYNGDPVRQRYLTTPDRLFIADFLARFSKWLPSWVE